MRKDIDINEGKAGGSNSQTARLCQIGECKIKCVSYVEPPIS